MAFPVVAVKLPASLTNASNGKLHPDQLVDVDFPGRGGGQLHFQASRAWAAFSNHCQKETGVTLTVTSVADAYRNYDRQLATFTTRYEPISYGTYLITGSSKRKIFAYGSAKYWRLRPGLAIAATPGTSNHGLGLALDVCELRADGSVIGIAGSKAWNWVRENAVMYGFSWEVQSEPWHLRLFTGDNPTQLVTDFFSAGQETPWPPFIPEQGVFGLWPLAVKPSIGPGSSGDIVRYLQGVIMFKAGGNINVNGIYDGQTEMRVRDLQRFFGLTVDGWCGAKQTWPIIDMLTSQ